MLGRKVGNLITHIGGLNAKITWDHNKDGATMLVTPVGIHIKSTNLKAFKETLIPWPNVVEARLLPEEASEVVDLPKRGRPPKEPESVA